MVEYGLSVVLPAKMDQKFMDFPIGGAPLRKASGSLRSWLAATAASRRN